MKARKKQKKTDNVLVKLLHTYTDTPIYTYIYTYMYIYIRRKVVGNKQTCKTKNIAMKKIRTHSTNRIALSQCFGRQMP